MISTACPFAMGAEYGIEARTMGASGHTPSTAPPVAQPLQRHEDTRRPFPTIPRAAPDPSPRTAIGNGTLYLSLRNLPYAGIPAECSRRIFIISLIWRVELITRNLAFRSP